MEDRKACEIKKYTIYSEAIYFFGLFAIALGVALMETGKFGIPVIVAPAYIIYRRLSLIYPSFTFGTAEYCFQGLLLLLLSIPMHRFRFSYLLSFLTAVLYAFILDLCMISVGFLPQNTFSARFVIYIFGMISSALGVSLMFHTYIFPEAYELVVKELALKFDWKMHKVKISFDLCCLIVAILLSLILFDINDGFVGIGWGTVANALLCGWIIGKFSILIDKHLEIKDGLKLRKYFETFKK